MIGSLFFLALLGGLGYGLWSAATTATAGRNLDTAHVVRSAAVAIGLYLAMLANIVGLLDLLQALADRSRIAGSSADVARGMALLIVGVPLSLVLLRTIDRDHRDRVQEHNDDQPGLGWSAHLIAMLTTTLIGTLVSAAQIIEDFVGRQRSIDSDVVAQLAAWALGWIVYWFVLRRRHGVLGAAHLAIGTTIGLGWLAAGVIGTAVLLLSNAYDRLFDTVLINDTSVLRWVLIACVGLVVWLWHWVALNATRGVEHHSRHSSSWFVYVVAVAIVPATIALAVVIGIAITLTLIWFIGSPTGPAADWFEPTPALLAVGCTAAAAFAFHRWQIQRATDPRNPVRNESIRFHDYALTAVGLIAVVGASAMLVTFVFDTLAASRTIVQSFDAANRLIGIVVALVLGGSLWWTTWNRIDRHRRHSPTSEIDSTSGKVYVTATAAIGVLTLAVSLIWVLFATLRDLFDGEIGLTTLSQLAGPLGWAIAIVGAVWFHVGVWRADRTHMASVEPPAPAPPPPPTGPPLRTTPPPGAATPSANPTATITVRRASHTDTGALFTLHRADLADRLLADPATIVVSEPESFDDFTQRVGRLNALVAIDDGRIIGALIADPTIAATQVLAAPDQSKAAIRRLLLEAAAVPAPQGAS